MSPPKGGPPYRVAYSDRHRIVTRELLARAQRKGRLAEVAQVVRDIHTRLEWIPLDFGQPTRDLDSLGIQLRVAVVAPVVVTYAVDEARRLVYVTVPLKLLPKSGLEAVGE